MEIALEVSPTNSASYLRETRLLDFKLRQLQPELMDNPALEFVEHKQALNGLARIHRLNNTPARIWQTIRVALSTHHAKTYSVLDLGCGDGFLLRQLHSLARNDGVALKLIGCDFSHNAIEIAGRAAECSGVPIELHHVDVTEVDKLPVSADVVFCSLFLHHFSEPQAIAVLKTIHAAARKLVLVHDLRRTHLGYALCWVGVHTFSRSKVVHTDGLLSVRAAFSIEEITQLLSIAGIDQAQIFKHWPQRFTITWSPAEQSK